MADLLTSGVTDHAAIKCWSLTRLGVRVFGTNSVNLHAASKRCTIG